jgi:hypothetical protein
MEKDMKKRNPTRTRQTRSKANGAVYTRYFLLTAVCGVALVASFFFAARQHFSSIDYSMQNNKLKRQIEELESDKKRLVLAREVSLSPAEIKKAAKKIGFVDSVQTETALLKTTPAADLAVKPTKAVAAKAADTPKLVQKTVQTAAIDAPEKQKTTEKSAKRDPMTRERKVPTSGR